MQYIVPDCGRYGETRLQECFFKTASQTDAVVHSDGRCCYSHGVNTLTGDDMTRTVYCLASLILTAVLEILVKGLFAILLPMWCLTCSQSPVHENSSKRAA